MITNEIFEVKSYFDGEHLQYNGPYTIKVKYGKYTSISRTPLERKERSCKHVEFLMPSMVEAHCHLFLDGDELDFSKRSQYMKSSRELMIDTALANVEKYCNKGIKVIRDAGDSYGINLELRERLKGTGVTLLCAGQGIRKKKRYGSFMAREVDSRESIEATVKEIAKTADVIKIVLTGIIDFENGVVKGVPQFSTEEANLIVDIAHDLGLKTFAHCSGLDGLKIAVNSGVDSIEHGFFMNQDILTQMAQKEIAWVPTFIPVHFQRQSPHYCGWNSETVAKLNSILDNHNRMLNIACEWGVPIMAGSDGGSYGVKHGDGLIMELQLMRQAGLSEEQVLKSVTNNPREHFNLPVNNIKVGCIADYNSFAESPCVDSYKCGLREKV